MRHRNRSQAFTLVELLVVIAIIIALLAILMPSMGKAVYIAQLARCASNLKQTGTGYLSSAVDTFGQFKSYDHTKVTHLKEGGSDMRPALRSYIAYNLLACPFNEPINYVDPPITSNWVEWTYFMFAGFKYNGETKRLSRPGDYFEFNKQRFSVLAGDQIITKVDGTTPHGSHPARGMGLYTSGSNTGSVATAVSYNPSSYTFIRWENSSGTMVAPGAETDLNFVFSDGSARQYTRVTWNDDGLTFAPPFKAGVTSTWWSWLPAN